MPELRHFEFLVEDASGKVALKALLPNILSPEATFAVHAYRGIGKLPADLKPRTDASKRILLDNLPRLMSGYGRAFAGDPSNYTRTVVVVCDLDDRDAVSFSNELNDVVNTCRPKPRALVCLSVEEGEAWLLGDAEAVLKAYPRANSGQLLRYTPDDICGTWEYLADVVEPGGSRSLKVKGFAEIGRVKVKWAASIGPHVRVATNRSPSFHHLVACLC